jgi:hypothetical protein
METDKLAWPSNRMTRMRPRLKASPLPSTLASFGSWLPREETKVVRRSVAVVDANGRSSYGIGGLGNILPLPRRSITGSPTAPPSPRLIGLGITPPSPRLSATLAPPSSSTVSALNLPPLISTRLHALLTTLGPVWWLHGGEAGAAKSLIAEGGKLEFTLRLWELAAQAWQSTKNSTTTSTTMGGDAAAARSILSIATGAARGNLSGFEYGTLRTPLMAEFSRLVSQHALQLRGALNSAASDAEQILMAQRNTDAQVATILAERRLADVLRGRTSATSPKLLLSSVSTPQRSPLAFLAERRLADELLGGTSATSSKLSTPQRSPLAFPPLSRSHGGGGGAGARYTSPLPSPTFERSPSSTPQPPDAWLWRGSENTENEDMATSEAHLKKELSAFRSQIKAAPARLTCRLPDTMQDDESLVPLAATAALAAATTLRPVRPMPIPWKSPADNYNYNNRNLGPIVFAASSLSLTPHNLSTASLSSLGAITAAFSLYEASEGGGDLTPVSSNNNNNNYSNNYNNSRNLMSRSRTSSPLTASLRLSPLSQQFLGSRLIQTRLGHSHLDKLLH